MLCRLARKRRNTTFGQNVRALRRERGWSQVELAQRLGVRQPDLSGWETGGVPALDKVVQLALVFDRSLDDLMKGINPNYDLLRHGSSVQSQSGGVDAPDSARVQELEALVNDYARTIAAVTKQLVGVATRGEQVRAARDAQSKRRRHHREAG